MKPTLLMLIAVLATATALAAPSTLYKSGDCKLQVSDSFDDAKIVKVELTNADIQVSCSYRGGDFFGDFMVFANPTIKNKSGKKLDVSYQVAFFNKAGELVVCAAQKGDVDANEGDMQFGSCMSKVPQAEFAKIASYKVVVYVDVAKEKK